MASTSKTDSNDAEDRIGSSLSWLEYHPRDDENGKNRTIQINGNPQCAIKLRRHLYYSTKAIEGLVYGFCDKHTLDPNLRYECPHCHEQLTRDQVQINGLFVHAGELKKKEGAA